MTLKELKNQYKITDMKDYYLLFSLTEKGKRWIEKYIWHIYKDKTKKGYFYVEGYESTSKIDVLIANINEKVASLPYDSEYYIPSLRKELFVVLIVGDLMYEMGFKVLENDLFEMEFKDEPKTNIIVRIDMEEVHSGFGGYKSKLYKENKANVQIYTDEYSYMQITTERTPEDIMDGVSTLLNIVLYKRMYNSLSLIKKMEKHLKLDLKTDIIKGELKGFSVDETNYNSELKTKLLEMANKL